MTDVPQSPKNNNRPLSPHIQVYRWRLPMLMSILHRMAGMALAVGTLMVGWMLLALASGPETYLVFRAFITGPLGKLVLFGWSVALFYHMMNGVRHLIWDCGFMFKIREANLAGLLVIAFTLLLTVLAWSNAFINL